MNKLIKELSNEGAFAPACIVRYLKRRHYLNVSEILRHLENIESYGFRQIILIFAIYEFYDLYAVELFQLHREIFTQSERSERKYRSLSRQTALYSVWLK
jgi:hypothetical protein